jgi:hypothetical protein
VKDFVKKAASKLVSVDTDSNEELKIEVPSNNKSPFLPCSRASTLLGKQAPRSVYFVNSSEASSESYASIHDSEID